MRNMPNNHPMRVRLLPNFYSTDFNHLPGPVDSTREKVTKYLSINYRHGVVILREQGDVVIWGGNKPADPYYTLPIAYLLQQFELLKTTASTHMYCRDALDDVCATPTI